MSVLDIVVYDEDIDARFDAMALAAEADMGVTMRAWTWLPGDFDPRTLRRRRGWKLRHYRGDHRTGSETVAGLRVEIAVAAERTRRFHLQSLRRPTPTGPVWIGEYMTNLKFYGVPKDLEIGTAYLEIVPDQGETFVPFVDPRVEVIADDALTGPIVMDAEQAHRGRLARIAGIYETTKHEFDLGVTR